MASYYDYGEVARSVFIAVLASCAALDLAGRVTAGRGRIRLAWLAGGSLAMGLGIWTMHFKGMLAFHLPVQVAYDWPTVMLSLLLAILASAFSLYVVSRPRLSIGRASAGSVIMGVGIAAMHYVGMAAMRLPAIMCYRPLIVSLSVALAIAFSFVALLLAFHIRAETPRTFLRKIGGAMVMGAAVSAMHYTGMASVSFLPSKVVPDMSHAGSISVLGNNGIGLFTVIVLAVTMLTASAGRRVEVELRSLNERLEHRVLERTHQLTTLNEELRKEIVERQRAQDALHESQDKLTHVTRVLAMGGLAASIAHEVNQPLTSVVTNAGFCLRELAGASPNLGELREALTEIVSDGNRASAVIARVRSFLGRAAPETREVDINEAIEEVTRLVYREVTKRRVCLRLDLAPDSPRVFGDRVQLQQVLINLIMNAIEEMIAQSGCRDLLIKTSTQQDVVVVGVQDSGKGLDTEKAEHIFEPFFSTKPNGIGMGLWISRSIVESHGGRLWSESNSEGALFQFTVPAVAKNVS
jgi:NO-binding membrane sensor protein with MHYT domain